MRISLLNLPASVVKTVRGKRYMLNGTLLSINESANTCKILFGRNVKNVSLDNVYLNEDLLDTIKSFGKKVWDKIKGVVKLAKGFIVPVDESGKKLFEFFNLPVNILGMRLSSAVKIAPADSTFEQATDNGMSVMNDETIDSAFESALIREAEEANIYWGRIMKEYAKNESMSISRTIKYVNEKYYHKTRAARRLNETIDSLSSKGGLYGVEMHLPELKNFLKQNIYKLINSRNGASAVIVWGAPGIGKSAVISQIAKDIKKDGKYDLNTIVIQCGALHSDDFTLPGTAKNIAGVTVAEDIAKTWLPVYSSSLKQQLPYEEWQRIDDLYNSGRYGLVYNLSDDLGGSKKDDGTLAFKNTRGEDVASFLPTKVDASGNIYKTGGILFFDEIARMADKATQSVVMNLVADRRYGTDMILATRWAIVAAANRRSDDSLPEFDAMGDGIDALRMPAAKSRYIHVTYVPSLEDWLDWARSPRSETDDRLNVLEMFCEFVERMGEKALYDCIGCGGHATTDEEVSKLIGVTAGETGAQATTKMSKDDFMRQAIEDLEEYQSEHNQYRKAKMTTFNPRAMVRNVSEYLEHELETLFEDVPGGFDNIWAPVTHQDRDGRSRTTKTISANLLKKYLKDIDKDTWMEWCENHSIDHTTGKGDNWHGWKVDARGDRYAFIQKWLSYCVFPLASGAGSVQAELWKNWNEYGKTMTQEAIKNIWRTGCLADKNSLEGAEDLLTFNQPDTFMQFERIAWKATPAYIGHIINDVLNTDYYNVFNEEYEEEEEGTDFFNENLATEIKKIAKLIKNNNNTVPTMPADVINKWKDHFYYTLYTIGDNESYQDDATEFIDDKHAADSYTPLFRDKRGLSHKADAMANQQEMNNKLAFVLENSTVAQELANVAKYFHQIAKQTNTAAMNINNGNIEEFFQFKTTEPMSDPKSKYIKDRELQQALTTLLNTNVSIPGAALAIIKNIGRS